MARRNPSETLALKKSESYKDSLLDWNLWADKITDFLKSENLDVVFNNGHAKELLNQTISEIQKKCFDSILAGQTELTADDDRLIICLILYSKVWLRRLL